MRGEVCEAETQRCGQSQSETCRDRMLNEADTCRRFVLPKLTAAGWDIDPHSIAEQKTINDGRIVPRGTGFVRKSPKRVDYLLQYRRDFPLAVVEAKDIYHHAADPSRAPAHILGAPTASGT